MTLLVRWFAFCEPNVLEIGDRVKVPGTFCGYCALLCERCSFRHLERFVVDLYLRRFFFAFPLERVSVGSESHFFPVA